MSNDPPFPGMDPYIEARHLWKGIHTQLIGELSTHLPPPLLAPGYYVDVEPSLQVRADQTVYPDLQVLAAHRSPSPQPVGLVLAVAQATMSLTTFPATIEEEDETALFIREATSEQLVTVVEILSHSNKTNGADKRARYLTKRRDLIQSGATSFKAASIWSKSTCCALDSGLLLACQSNPTTFWLHAPTNSHKAGSGRLGLISRSPPRQFH